MQLENERINGKNVSLLNNLNQVIEKMYRCFILLSREPDCKCSQQPTYSFKSGHFRHR